MDDGAILAVVERCLGSILERHGLSLYDLEVHRGRHGGVLRVFIDKPGGVDVEDCARVSEVLSRVLDVEDPIPFPYDLEVSSPGLTRKLTKPRHYAGSVGHPVHVDVRGALPDGRRGLDGTLSGLHEVDGRPVVTVEVAGMAVAVPLEIVAAAYLTLPPPPKPGKPGRRRR